MPTKPCKFQEFDVVGFAELIVRNAIRMSRFLNLAKAVCRQPSRFCLANKLQYTPAVVSVKSYSTSFVNLDAAAFKDEVIIYNPK
jgi:hypothetical protein